jgi:regulator of protease activity HflC (stomatin/prohibitin superfamily)
MEAALNRMQKLGVGLILGGVLLSRFIFVVDGGQRGVKFDRIYGVQNKVYGEGMHFVVPFFQVFIYLNQYLITLL